MFHIDLSLLNLLVAVLAPAATAVAAHRFASPLAKTVILAAVVALGTGAEYAVKVGGVVDGRQFLIAMAGTFLLAVAAHFGVLKPAGVTGSEGAIAKSLPAGLGGLGPGAGPGV
jgi:hypothetical protein